MSRRPGWLFALPALAACTIFDDITVYLDIPAAVQADFAERHPDTMLRPVVLFDGVPASYGALCELGAADAEMMGKYLQAGCYEAHDLEVYLTALDVASGVPCGNDFQLNQGERELDQYAPSATFQIPATDNGRCGREWSGVTVTVAELAEE